MAIQRFKATLTTGHWRDNPEPLVRDPDGDYVKFSEVINLLETFIGNLIDQHEGTIITEEFLLARYEELIKSKLS